MSNANDSNENANGSNEQHETTSLVQINSPEKERLETEAEPAIPAFEKLLEEVGPDGVFQKRLIWLFMVPFTFSYGFAAVHFILIVATPKHNCFIPGRETSQNASLDEWRNMTIPWEKSKDGSLQISECKMYNITYYPEFSSEMGENNAHWDDVAMSIDKNEKIDCQYGWEYDHSVWEETVSSSFDWVCDDRGIITKLMTLKMIGGAIGLLAFSILSDKFGRLPWFYLTLTLVVIFGPALAMAPSLLTFSIFLFIFALPFYSMYQMPFLVVMEICSEKLRSTTIISTFLAFRVSLCLLPLITWLVAEWKTLVVVLNIQMVIYFFFWRILPESPRWLLSQDKIPQFKKVMQKIARTNGKILSPEFDNLVFIAQEEEKKKVPYSDILKSNLLLKHLILTCIIMSLGNMFYTGIDFNLHNMTGNTFVNFFILNIFEVPGNIVGSHFSERFGRRFTTFLFELLSAASIIMTVPFITNKWAVVGLCAISKSFVGGMFLAIFKQVGELFPTPLRATAYGITGITGFASTVVVPSIMALGAVDAKIPYYFMFGFSLLGAIISTFLPETLGLPFPQTIREALNIGKDQSYFSVYYKGKNRNIFKSTSNKKEVSEMRTEV